MFPYSTISKLQKQCSLMGDQRSTSDMISNLPSNVTDNILKSLPLRDAVRTCVLSSRWRYKWVTLPKLAFDYQFFLNSWGNEKFKAIIYQVLLHHHGPLIEFRLYPPFESCLDINNWIFILLKKNIQKFTYYLNMGPYHEFPCHLSSFLQLRHLNLAKCVFKPPRTLKGYSRLVNLDFHDVVIDPEMFGQFISSCPLLERLKLHCCNHFGLLEINAPNLKDFTFFGVFKQVSFENASLLGKISITLLSWDFTLLSWDPTAIQLKEGRDSDWVKFFRSVPAVEDLHLDRSFLESLSAGNVPMRLPSTLSHLKVLALSDLWYYNLHHVTCALCLLRSSPNLQEFIISMLNDVPIQDPVVEFLQAQDFSNFSLNQLRNVKIRFFSGAEPEIHFVKLLLAHSTVLEEMAIWHHPDISDEKGFAILKELIRFPRASPKAEFLFMAFPDE